MDWKFIERFCRVHLSFILKVNFVSYLHLYHPYTHPFPFITQSKIFQCLTKVLL